MCPSQEVNQVIREWSEVFMHRSMRDFKRFMDETDLSYSQISVLMRLKHGGKSGVSKIGGQMGVTNAAASQAVDRLVHLGLIERTEDPDDRRAKRLALTEAGRTMIDTFIDVRSRWVENVTDALTPEQQNNITEALTLLIEAARRSED